MQSDNGKATEERCADRSKIGVDFYSAEGAEIKAIVPKRSAALFA